jgi:hypothetical protein
MAKDFRSLRRNGKRRRGPDDSEINRVAGEIALLSPKIDVAKAEQYFEKALSVARQQQAKSWELRAAMSLSHAYPHANFPDRLVRPTVTSCKRGT